MAWFSSSFLSMVGPALGECADSCGQAANNQDAINDLRMPYRKKLQYRYSVKIPKLLKCERPSQSAR
jgi:hypothetical protein